MVNNNSNKKRSGNSKPKQAKDSLSHKKRRKRASLLDDDFSYVFDSPAGPDEFANMYLGKPSFLDDIDPAEEYLSPTKAKEKKPSTTKRKSLLEGCDYEEFVFNDQPSALPPGPLSPPTLPTVQAVARPSPSTTDEEEVKDRALRIAEDFAKRENVILVGGIPCVYNGRFYEFLHDDDAQRQIYSLYRNEIGRSSAASVLRNAVSLLKYCVNIVYGEFPPNSNIIIFENGTLEADTGHFRANSPSDLASSALGIRYDPNRSKMPCTKYFLETIADGDNDLYELMLQVIGYILSNDLKAKSFFYLEGVGDAGKSRFCDLIASFFPASGANKVARVALQDLGKKFALGNLVNVKLNISEDLPDSPLSPTTVSRIKMISDSNRLEAEAKYVQPFSFRPLCKLLFASNHPLRLKEHDAAFINRVIYIPFLHPIPKAKQDKDILEKMQGELPALFNHAFEAYRRLVANGYNWAGAERFKPSISVANSSISIDKGQILKRFIADCCDLDENAVTSTADLQVVYNKFCHEHTYLPVQGDRFSRELLGVLPDTVARVKIGNQKRGFKGIRLRVSTNFSEFNDTDDDLE